MVKIARAYRVVMLQEPYQIPARLFQVINCISLIWGAHQVLHNVPRTEIPISNDFDNFVRQLVVVRRVIDFFFRHSGSPSP